MTIAPEVYKVHAPLIWKRARPRLPLGTATHDNRLLDPAYLNILRDFHRITPEVAGCYFWVYSYGQGWASMDNITKWARDHGRELYYHCLIWHTWCVPNDPPDWEAWIVEALEHNPGAYDIVVVNEGYSPLGDRTFFYIEDAYRLTRQLRPTARLWYNGLLDEQGEQDQVLRLISEGLVDGVGIQAHLNLYSNMGKFDYLLQRLTVPWAITELDVIVPVDDDYYRGLQALVYRDVVNMAHDRGAIWVCVWECVDKFSWQLKNFPTPNDVNYLPKPAMTELKR